MNGAILKGYGCGVHLVVFCPELAEGVIFRLLQKTKISYKKKVSEVGHSKALSFYSADPKGSITGLR